MLSRSEMESAKGNNFCIAAKIIIYVAAVVLSGDVQTTLPKFSSCAVGVEVAVSWPKFCFYQYGDEQMFLFEKIDYIRI